MEEVLEQTKHVQALLPEGDKKILYKYAHKVPDNGTIVDIGTAGGGSSIIMAMASKPSVKVYTIDPNRNENFFVQREKLDLVDKITFMEDTSVDVARDWVGEEIDMLFVDGIHSYNGVMDDWNGLGQFVKKGGIIAFHDVVMYSNTIGFAVEELIKDGKVLPVDISLDKWKDGRITGLQITMKL